MDDWLLYGAYGYTGRRILKEALERGHRPRIAGRNREKLEALARDEGLDAAVASLDDENALERALDGCALVVHAAGPFVQTSEPMLRSCLRKQVSYLDITGELPVFERTLSCHEEALVRGILVTSGMGFDVVPGDCLAAYVADQLREPSELEIAYLSLGQASGGTVKSALGIVRGGGRVLRRGALESRPLGAGSKTLWMWDEEKSRALRRVRGIPAPLGDLLTAARTTGIDHVTAYLALPWIGGLGMVWLGPLLPALLKMPGVTDGLTKRIDRIQLAPNDQRRALVWAQARSERGARAEAWLSTCDAYTFTAKSVVLGVERYFESRPVGALTPAQAFGSDFVLGIPTTRRYPA